MPFKQRSLCAEITLILSAGFLLSTPRSAEAQLPQFSCRPNDNGDGWICESTQPQTPNTAAGNSRYNSTGAVLRPVSSRHSSRRSIQAMPA